MTPRLITWVEIQEKLADFETGWSTKQVVYGIPRNGMLLTAFLKYHSVTNDPKEATTFLDDLIDSAETRKRYNRMFPEIPFHALFTKQAGDPWFVFPWEQETGPEDAVVRLLQYIGQDTSREGLRDTPKRVIKAYAEMTEGYSQDPSKILGTLFTPPVPYDQLVVLENIHFTSLCEHHLLPFSGKAAIGYLPKDGKVVGLSKLARLVECFARRLQLQEQLTEQIAKALSEHVPNLGVGVIIRAEHSCMSCRGVRQLQTQMCTSYLTGVLRTDPSARAEFMALAR